MQLLIVGRFTGTGGAERSLMPLAQELAQLGYELTLLLLKHPDNETVFRQFPGRVIMPVGSRTSRLQCVWHLWQAIAATDLVIATSELTPTYLAWLLCRWQHKPLIADVQVYLSCWIENACHPLHHQICRWIYPQIGQIRCVAQGVAEDLHTHYHVPARQLVVIPVPFDLAAIAQAAQASIPLEHHVWFERPTLVAVGRLTSQKRFDLAISALHQLRQIHSLDANLLILGEGELRPQLEQQVQQLELGDRVFLPGLVENPHVYISRAQGFLLSSDYEGLPRVLIEALAVGCPVVSTNCPSGPDEILQGGKWGLLVPPRDVSAIAEALLQILTDQALAERLRQAGQQRSRAFATAAIVEQYHALIQQVHCPLAK